MAATAPDPLWGGIIFFKSPRRPPEKISGDATEKGSQMAWNFCIFIAILLPTIRRVRIYLDR